MGRDAPAPTALGAAAAMLESGLAKEASRCAVLKVGGMTCSNCSTAVERALRGLKFVHKAEVDLINERATVEYRAGPGCDAQALCDCVEEIGFEAAPVEDRALSVAGASGARASIHFADPEAPEASATALRRQPGVLDVEAKSEFLKVSYDPAVIGARALLKIVQASSSAAVLDPAGAGATQADEQGKGTFPPGLVMAVVCTTLIMVICWVLPCFKHCTPFLYREVVPGLPMMTMMMCMLAIPVQFVSGRKFHVGAYHSLKSGVWDMNVLISLGTFLTFAYSVSVILFMMLGARVRGAHRCKAPPASYFEAPCTVITFILIGKTLEHWAKRMTSRSLRELLALQPKEANLLEMTSPLPSVKESSTPSRRVPAELLELGDRLHVFPGEAAPTDGIMASEDGVAEFDESLLTGESRPVLKRKGDFVIGGSRCVSGRAEVTVERLGNKTMLSQIAALVEKSQLARAPVQQVADAVAHHFVPCVIFLATATWTAWYFVVYHLRLVSMNAILHGRHSEWPQLDKFFFVMEHGLTVLLVACPCALGLATPTAVMTATGVAAKHGILVRSGAAPLELGSKVERLVLDKTGTITSGRPRVMHAAAFCPDQGDAVVGALWQRLLASFRAASAVAQHEQQQRPPALVGHPSPDCLPAEGRVAMAWLNGEVGPLRRVRYVGAEAAASRERLREEATAALWWAIGSAEQSSEHPLARELTTVAGAVLRGAPFGKPADFQNVTGVGVSCTVGSLEVQVSSAKHILGLTADRCPPLAEWVRAARSDGSTVVCLAIGGTPLAGVALRDTLAPAAKACVAELQLSGIEVWMCTGDHETAAMVVAKEVGIDTSRVISEALPGDKVAVVHRLQDPDPLTGRGRHIVAMVGDGVNDAPALAAADLGVAIGAGHDVTVHAADIVLVRTDLCDLVAFFELARTTLRTIWRNFIWAFVFNTCALPVAAGAFWHRGILMSPQIAVCLMLSSSLFVVLSSLSLRGFQPPALQRWVRH